MLEKLPFHTAPSARITFRRALVAGDEEKALAAYTAVDARGATLQNEVRRARARASLFQPVSDDSEMLALAQVYPSLPLALLLSQPGEAREQRAGSFSLFGGGGASPGGLGDAGPDDDADATPLHVASRYAMTTLLVLFLERGGAIRERARAIARARTRERYVPSARRESTRARRARFAQGTRTRATARARRRSTSRARAPTARPRASSASTRCSTGAAPRSRTTGRPSARRSTRSTRRAARRSTSRRARGSSGASPSS